MRVTRLAAFCLTCLADGASLVTLPLAAQENALIGRVTDSLDQAPLPGAKVAIASLGISATTDNDGRYVLPVPAEAAGTTVEVRVTLHPFHPGIQEVTLGPGATADFELGFSYFEELTVGSRAVGVEAAKSVPVEIHSEERLDTTGASETNAILEALTPSFNFPQPTITDGTDSVRPATLRGLGSDQVLVLINGVGELHEPELNKSYNLLARPLYFFGTSA